MFRLSSLLESLFARPANSRCPGRITPLQRRSLEQLEDRTVPAVTWYVDNTPTNGGGGGNDQFTSVGGNVSGLTIGTDLFTTIQAAINAASAGDTILVADGSYAENVTIDRNLKLLSQGGKDVTTIDGQGNTALGTILLEGTTTFVTIGGIGQGFTLRGIDNASAGIESAALYVKGTHSGTTIQGNEIEARGDSGLTAEFGANVSSFLIDTNEFSGTTFIPAPAGSGFDFQFTEANVPRQLIVMGNGGGSSEALATGITFTNNLISGTAGGLNNLLEEQGNTLVTLDVANSTITDNDFTGKTTRFGSMLRVRRSGTTIADNTFSDTNLSGGTGYLTVQNQGDAAVLNSLYASNTFGQAAYTSTLASANGLGTIYNGAVQGAISQAAAGGATIVITGGHFIGGIDASTKSLTFQIASATTTALVNLTGNLTLTSDDTLVVNFNGATAGTGFDQLNVTGTAQLGNSTLQAIVDSVFAAAVAQGTSLQFITAGTLSGEFGNFANGASALLGGKYFRVFYSSSGVRLLRNQMVGPTETFTAGNTGTLTGSVNGGQTVSPSGAPLVYSLASRPLLGTLALRSNGAFIYRPIGGVIRPVTFSYRIFDGLEWSNPITVTIQITGKDAVRSLFR